MMSIMTQINKFASEKKYATKDMIAQVIFLTCQSVSYKTCKYNYLSINYFW
jgi:hypothetical protein